VKMILFASKIIMAVFLKAIACPEANYIRNDFWKAMRAKNRREEVA
jgi:hypothetical protein